MKTHCTTDILSVEINSPQATDWKSVVQYTVARQVLFIHEIPAGGFPLGMNPPYPLVNGKPSFFGFRPIYCTTFQRCSSSRTIRS